MIVNRVAIVVDQSQSMSGIRYDVERRTNELLRDIRARKDQQNVASVYVFSEDVLGPMENYPSTFLGQNTALLDAVGKAIEDLSAYDSKLDVANLVIVLTDGEENRSRFYEGKKTYQFGARNWDGFSSKKSLPDLIQKKQAEGNWTFAFQLPPGKADAFSREFGIPRNNCSEWEGTKQGFEETSIRTQSSFATYSAVRAAGQTQSRSFYEPVTPDLSKVKVKDLKQLDNLTARFAQHTVAKESSIKEFVESKTKQPYVPGTAYFQLSKPEKVQYTKQIALVPIGKKSVFGGEKARDLIGLSKFKDAKVSPGNHGDYEIYVQSNSTNRILVRGSKVLILK